MHAEYKLERALLRPKTFSKVFNQIFFSLITTPSTLGGHCRRSRQPHVFLCSFIKYWLEASIPPLIPKTDCRQPRLALFLKYLSFILKIIFLFLAVLSSFSNLKPALTERQAEADSFHRVHTSSSSVDADL